jgi:hypothetical protein
MNFPHIHRYADGVFPGCRGNPGVFWLKRFRVLAKDAVETAFHGLKK